MPRFVLSGGNGGVYPYTPEMRFIYSFEGFLEVWPPDWEVWYVSLKDVVEMTGFLGDSTVWMLEYPFGNVAVAETMQIVATAGCRVVPYIEGPPLLQWHYGHTTDWETIRRVGRIGLYYDDPDLIAEWSAFLDAEALPLPLPVPLERMQEEVAQAKARTDYAEYGDCWLNTLHRLSDFSRIGGLMEVVQRLGGVRLAHTGPVASTYGVSFPTLRQEDWLALLNACRGGISVTLFPRLGRYALYSYLSDKPHIGTDAFWQRKLFPESTVVFDDRVVSSILQHLRGPVPVNPHRRVLLEAYSVEKTRERLFSLLGL